MQLCDKASAHQPRATFVLLASHCDGAGGGGGGGGGAAVGEVISLLSLSLSLFLVIPDLDTDFGKLVGAHRDGA